jgi:hypothetical protein
VFGEQGIVRRVGGGLQRHVAQPGVCVTHPGCEGQVDAGQRAGEPQQRQEVHSYCCTKGVGRRTRQHCAGAGQGGERGVGTHLGGRGRCQAGRCVERQPRCELYESERQRWWDAETRWGWEDAQRQHRVRQVRQRGRKGGGCGGVEGGGQGPRVGCHKQRLLRRGRHKVAQPRRRGLWRRCSHVKATRVRSLQGQLLTFLRRGRRANTLVSAVKTTFVRAAAVRDMAWW